MDTRSHQIMDLVRNIDGFSSLRGSICAYVCTNRQCTYTIYELARILQYDPSLVYIWHEMEETLSKELSFWNKIKSQWHLDVVRAVLIVEGMMIVPAIHFYGVHHRNIVRRIEQETTEASESDDDEMITEFCVYVIKDKWATYSNTGGRILEDTVRTIAEKIRCARENESHSVEEMVLFDAFQRQFIEEKGVIYDRQWMKAFIEYHRRHPTDEIMRNAIRRIDQLDMESKAAQLAKDMRRLESDEKIRRSKAIRNALMRMAKIDVLWKEIASADAPTTAK